MTVVVDTNVFISALVFNKKVQEILESLLTFHEVTISPFILNELIEKLKTKFGFTKEDVDLFVNNLKPLIKIVEPTGEMPTASKDVDDNNILLLAYFTNANAIISGDKDLNSLKFYKGIPIFKPGEFIFH